MMSPTLPTVPPTPWWRLSDKQMLAFGLALLISIAGILTMYARQNANNGIGDYRGWPASERTSLRPEQQELLRLLLAAPHPDTWREVGGANACTSGPGTPTACLALLEKAARPWMDQVCDAADYAAFEEAKLPGAELKTAKAVRLLKATDRVFGQLADYRHSLDVQRRQAMDVLRETQQSICVPLRSDNPDGFTLLWAAVVIDSSREAQLRLAQQ